MGRGTRSIQVDRNSTYTSQVKPMMVDRGLLLFLLTLDFVSGIRFCFSRVKPFVDRGPLFLFLGGIFKKSHQGIRKVQTN
jgi:hypothetical protein